MLYQQGKANYNKDNRELTARSTKLSKEIVTSFVGVHLVIQHSQSTSLIIIINAMDEFMGPDIQALLAILT